MIDIFFFQAEDGIRDADVTGVQTCALPISMALVVCGGAAGLGYMAPKIFIKNKIAKRKKLLRRQLPDALDLLVRSEERREGKSVDLGGRRIMIKKNNC